MALSILFVVQDVPRLTKVQTFSYCELCEQSYRIERNSKNSFCLNFGDPSLGTPHVEIL